MSFDNSTLPDSPTIKVNEVALDILLEAAVGAASAAIQISLLCLSFGVLTVLTLACIYVIISRGSVAQTSGKILILSIVVLYTSSATYVAACMWELSDGNRLILKAVDGIFSASYPGELDAIPALEHAFHKQSTMITLSLGGNLLIGDAIVWWRVCVIWQHKVVTCIGLLLLTLTAIFGIIGMARESHGYQTVGLTILFQESFGRISAILSLCTNVLATSLIAYKAWRHRQLVKRYFGANGATSGVLKTLALLVESGCVYCGILILVNIYYQETPVWPQVAAHGTVFRALATDFTVCLVLLVAIYPTIVIVIVALRRSPIDNAGLSQVRQAQGDRGSMTAEGGMSSTIVFHHSTFHGSTSVGTEGAMGGIPGSDSVSEGSFETMINEEPKPVGDLV